MDEDCSSAAGDAGLKAAALDVSALRRQEAGEFEKLVAAHQTLVMGLAQSMGLRGADLDDAACEVFAAVYRALPRFEGRSALSTWVYQIACRTIWRLRRRRDEHRVGRLDEGIELESGESPVDRAAASEQERMLWAAVAKLEPRQAMAIELHYRRGMSVEEVGAILECPVGTVKTLLFRGRERLRQVVGRVG
jgi:RNA polymerase sigma-70 factor (ECF subfamily)